MARPRALKSSPISIRCSERGFTLIELMVALALGLVVAGAILITQLRLTQQNTIISDTFDRDSESRAAMDLLTRDVTSSGFLIGGDNEKCSTVLNYNTNANAATSANGYFASFGISSMPAAKGTALPFTLKAGGITLNYPATGDPNRSDVIVISGSTTGAQMTQLKLLHNPTNGYDPMTTGVTPVTPDPNDDGAIYTAGLPNKGDTGLLWMTFDTKPPSLNSICLRVPIDVIVTSAQGVSSVGSTNAQFMPPNFYTGFGNQVPTLAGWTGIAGLSDTDIEGGTLIDAGVAANDDNACRYCTYAYYVDSGTGAVTYPAPTLVRATVNALDDVVVGVPQAVATGVVSVQMAYGVDPGNTGAVAAYLPTWAAVMAAGDANYVRTVVFAIITRSIQPDPRLNTVGNVAQGNLAGAQFPPGNDPDFTNYTGNGGRNLFTPYTLANQDFYRYFVQKTEIGVVRNCATKAYGGC